MFKIRCSREEEEAVITLTTQAIERIIKTNLDSEKAFAMDVWDESKITPDELREIEFFQAPRSIIDCLHKSKWEMPRNNDFEQFTILDLLPVNSLSTIQRSTDTTLVLFNGAVSTWIGADAEDKIALVKNRLDTLARFFVSLTDRISLDPLEIDFNYYRMSTSKHGNPSIFSMPKKFETGKPSSDI